MRQLVLHLPWLPYFVHAFEVNTSFYKSREFRFISMQPQLQYSDRWRWDWNFRFDRVLKSVFTQLKLLYFLMLFVGETAKRVSTVFSCKGAFGRPKWSFWPHSANWPEVEYGWFRVHLFSNAVLCHCERINHKQFHFIFFEFYPFPFVFKWHIEDNVSRDLLIIANKNVKISILTESDYGLKNIIHPIVKQD